MLTSSNSTSSNSKMAQIAVQKSLCKEYGDRKVYLSDGTEFQIQLFNPLTETIGVQIHLNNESLGSIFVLKPGERVWLERYFDTNKKFKFETYSVDAGDSVVDKAIRNNGKVHVMFYKEVKKQKVYPIYEIKVSDNWKKPYEPYYCQTITTSCDNTKLNVNGAISEAKSGFATQDCYVSSSSCNLGSSCCDSVNTSSTSITTKETGIIEKGGASSQKFKDVDIDFEILPFCSETIQILPVSQKPMTSTDLQKKYCPYCGKKLNPKFKFCPTCGNKVE